MHDLSAKGRMRRDLRKARSEYVGSLSPEQRRRAEDDLAGQIAAVIEGVDCIASYAPMGNEIDPAAIERAARNVALPWFSDRSTNMEFRMEGDFRESGPWGVEQPPFAAPLARPAVILVPLVGATRAGDRLGQGQGHFDRCIADLRSSGSLTTVGLAWDCQIVEALPTDPWDETLDYVATPTALYRCR
jgi:5-formyltetrahydrofolate cyclo-ligase|tara:strand:+ start:46644 stop:47207 length:564 start_codon:yes stop_codon:yes gene_type:complete